MDIVERSLLDQGMAPDRIHVERFTVPEPVEAAATPRPTAPPARITIELGGRTGVGRPPPRHDHPADRPPVRPDRPVLLRGGQLRHLHGQVVDGSVTMRVNNALTDDEVAEGWVLTCQSVPVSPTVHVVYE